MLINLKLNCPPLFLTTGVCPHLPQVVSRCAAARKRVGNATKRGISDEKNCVLVARDRSEQALDFVTGNGPLTKTRLSVALKRVLDSYALLVSDANPSYTAYCHDEGFSHEIVNLSQSQQVNGTFHLQNVNAYNSRFNPSSSLG